jgi:hypothetical protein
MLTSQALRVNMREYTNFEGVSLDFVPICSNSAALDLIIFLIITVQKISNVYRTGK